MSPNTLLAPRTFSLQLSGIFLTSKKIVCRVAVIMSIHQFGQVGTRTPCGKVQRSNAWEVKLCWTRRLSPENLSPGSCVIHWISYMVVHMSDHYPFPLQVMSLRPVQIGQRQARSYSVHLPLELTQHLTWIQPCKGEEHWQCLTRSNQKWWRWWNVIVTAVSFYPMYTTCTSSSFAQMSLPDTSRHELDTPTKNRLVGYYLATGNAAAAARNQNIPPRTAQRVIHHFKQTGSTSNKPRTGRPSKLTDYDKRQIVRTARKNRRMPLTQITNQIAASISVSSVRRVLAEQGYHRRVARKLPFLTPHHKQLRRIWGNMNKHLKRRDWHRVIFSDESYIHVGDKCGRIFVTRRKDERLLDECLVPTFKQSSLRVMVWGCTVDGRKGLLVVMEYPGGKGGGMNSKRYQDQVLDAVFLKFYARMKRERRSVWFQQDGAPCHRSKSTTKGLMTIIYPYSFIHQIPLISTQLNIYGLSWNRSYVAISILQQPLMASKQLFSRLGMRYH